MGDKSRRQWRANRVDQKILERVSKIRAEVYPGEDEPTMRAIRAWRSANAKVDDILCDADDKSLIDLRDFFAGKVSGNHDNETVTVPLELLCDLGDATEMLLHLIDGVCSDDGEHEYGRQNPRQTQTP
jgi:hypothetical protein